LKAVGKVFALIKAKDAHKYYRLELVDKKQAIDFIMITQPDYPVTTKARFIGFFKNFLRSESLSNEQTVIHDLCLPVSNLNNYKKGDIIEIEIKFSILQQKTEENIQ